jgi:hemerythrin-like domain-containing protein
LIQHTDFTHEAERAEVVERVGLVNYLFHHHADTEDNRIFPMIEPYAPQIQADFEAQHETDHQLSENLEKCLARFTETNSPEQHIWAGQELAKCFHAFLAFNVEHMMKEETIINEVLWQYYTDAQLMAKVQEIGSSIPPEDNQHFMYWMLKGLATHEIVQWFNAIKYSAPAPVFDFVCQIAEKALPENKWNFVRDCLHEGVLLA